ncbi:MAG TPA: ABC transporter permease [Thermoanaerobaculia bacterium]
MTRLLATLRRDVTSQVRYGLYAVSVFIVLVWGVLLGLLPGAAEIDVAVIVPAFLAGNLLATTFYFMAGLVLLEKDEGTLSALVATPLRDSEYLLSKLITLTALAVVESLLVVALLFGKGFRWDLLIAGTALLGALYVLAGFLAVVRYDSINEWLFPSAVVVTALLIPLLPHFGLTRHGFYLHPATPAFLLLRAACDPASVKGWEIVYGLLGSLFWLGMGFVWARRSFDRFIVRSAGG